MKTAAAIAAAESRAEQSERRVLATEIQLGITRARIAELEAAAARRNDALATAGVKVLAASGVIKPGDVFQQHQMKQQFLSDAGLIPLAVGRVFNQRKRATK